MPSRKMAIVDAAGGVLSAFLDIVYPRVCGGCGRTADVASGCLCWECLARLEYVTRPFCSRCGDPVDGKVEHEYLCSWCRHNRPSFALARSAVRFRGPMRRALHAFKYEHMTCLGRDFSLLLERLVDAHYARLPLDAVTCVPLHPLKERSRTYNQSKVLAAQLARRLKLTLAAGCVRRIRPTQSQTGLKAPERRANVRGAFVATQPEWIEGRRFLLVDDVMTTGATVAECSRVLAEAGAAGVYVVTVARG